MDKFRPYVNYILSITDYVIAWVNKTWNSAMQKIFGLNPEFVPETDQVSVILLPDPVNEMLTDRLLGCQSRWPAKGQC
jgi:hypothetical protein